MIIYHGLHKVNVKLTQSMQTLMPMI